MGNIKPAGIVIMNNCCWFFNIIATRILIFSIKCLPAL